MTGKQALLSSTIFKYISLEKLKKIEAIPSN